MKRILIASGIVCLTSILLISSCSKIDTTDLGNELIPAVDNVNTFEIVMDVITDNKLVNDTTRMLNDEFHGVGIIQNDQEFGMTTATTYVAFSPTSYKSYPFQNKDSVTIDSVVLSLAYIESYGDSSAIQQFEVRQIDGRFKEFKDSLYYLGGPDFDLQPDLLSSALIDYGKLGDSVVYKNGKDTISKGRELRMKMDTAWARQFVNYDTTNAYNNDTLFKKVFAGLQIKASDASPNKNAIAYFNLSDKDKTRITFYCRVQNNGKTDTISPYFAYHNDAHANIIRRTPANGYLANVSNGTDNDEKLYIQSTPGSYASVKIPQLDTFRNCVINSAELIMEKYPSFEDFYAAPAYMFIEANSPAGDSSFTIRNGFLPVSSSPGYDLKVLGGIYKNSKYIINLSRYIQSLVTRKFRNNSLKIYAPFTAQPYYMPPNSDQPTNKVGIIINTPVAAGRVVLFGGGSTDAKKMRLRIIYTKI